MIKGRLSGRLFQGGGSECPDLFREFSRDFGKACPFGRRDPFQAKSSRINAQYIGQFLGHMEHLFGLYITIQVMTVADVSPGHQYPVSAFLKCLEDEIGVDPTRTHDPDDAQVGWVLKTADTGKVSR
jgi:hypothetical protein